MKIGEKLAVIARTKKISQQKIADECSVSRISIHRFFNGITELKATKFMEVCKFLGIDVSQQIDETLKGGFAEWIYREEKIREEHNKGIKDGSVHNAE